MIGGVDTHKHTHYAAVIDEHGQLLGHQEFAATDVGYLELLTWMRSHGTIRKIGVESTGAFGAALTRSLIRAGEDVVEANRPNRQARRMDGKSDRLDAEQIARAVLGRTATAVPKSKSGAVEVIRTLRVARASAVKARTQAFNNLFAVTISAPSPLRDELVALTKKTLVNRCLKLRPETDDLLALTHDPERLLMAGTKQRSVTWLADGSRSTKRPRPSAHRSPALFKQLRPNSSNCTESAPRSLPSFSSQQATTPAGSLTKQPSPSYAESLLSLPAADEGPADTDSVAAETAPRTAPSTSSPSSDYAITNPPAPMSSDGPPKDSANARSSAASSAISPVRSTPTCHTKQSQHHRSRTWLDEHRSIERFQQTFKKWLRAQPDQPTIIEQLQALLDLFIDEYNHRRPHRSLPHRATPAALFDTMPKALPAGSRDADTHDRIRHDKVDKTGAVTLRVHGRMHHIGIGRTHAILLIQDLNVRVVNAITGELLRELIIDPEKDYQPRK